MQLKSRNLLEQARERERERGTLVTRRPNISNTVVPSNIVIAVGARNSITWAGREGKGREALRAECAHDVE